MKKIVVLLVVLAMTGCTSFLSRRDKPYEQLPTRIDNIHDINTGKKKTTLQLPFTRKVFVDIYSTIIYLSKDASNGKESSDYMVSLFIESPYWGFFKSAVFVIDGEKINLEATKSVQEGFQETCKCTSGRAKEWSYFSVDRKFMEKITSGNSIEVTFLGIGLHKIEEYKLNAESVGKLREFGKMIL
jgi:uncharacterized protein YceK